MRYVIVSGDPLTTAQTAQLEQAGWLPVYLEAGDSLSDLDIDLSQVEAYLLGGLEHITSHELDQLPNLHLISFVGTGYEAFVEVSTARWRGIEIRNTPRLATNAVAEHALGLLLGLRRGIIAAAQDPGTHVGKKSTELAACRVGILGLGAVGTATARLLSPLAKDVVAWNRTHRDDAPVTQVTWEEATALDALVICLALTDETRGMVGENDLRRLAPSATLVNVASPEIVDPAALAAWLDRDPEARAGLDSYYTEPDFAPANDPHGLMARDQVAITPHIAALTVETWDRMVNLAVNNVSTAQARSLS